MSGLVKLRTTMDISKVNKYPVGHSQWEVRRITNKVRYTIVILKAGQFFGNEELLLDDIAHTESFCSPPPARKSEAISIGK